MKHLVFRAVNLFNISIFYRSSRGTSPQASGHEATAPSPDPQRVQHEPVAFTDEPGAGDARAQLWLRQQRQHQLGRHGRAQVKTQQQRRHRRWFRKQRRNAGQYDLFQLDCVDQYAQHENAQQRQHQIDGGATPATAPNLPGTTTTCKSLSYLGGGAFDEIASVC